jgi:predicted nucleotidyltransferase
MPNVPNHITRWRQEVDDLIETVNSLQQLAVEAARLGYPSSMTPEDFTGANSDIDIAKYGASMATIVAVLSNITEEQKNVIYTVKT